MHQNPLDCFYRADQNNFFSNRGFLWKRALPRPKSGILEVYVQATTGPRSPVSRPLTRYRAGKII